MHAAQLAIAISAVCPITNVQVGTVHDRTTWRFTPTSEATQAQIEAGRNVIETIDDPPDPPRGTK